MSKQKLRLLQKCAIIFFLALCLAGCKSSTDGYKFGEISLLAQGKTDKAMDGHGFTELYEHFFYPLKEAPLKILEIGIGAGGSLILWRDYFPNAQIFGIDIVDMSSSSLNSGRIRTFVADQANRDQLDAFIDKYGGDFDIIIDDGGHKMDQQQISFGHLFKYVKPGGYYVIEDVHTSLPQYYSEYGVEEDGTNSTLVMIELFLKKAIIKSKYLEIQEEDYLRNNIEYCHIFFRNDGLHSIACVFKKRIR
jgi:SAM-dependent methyltransferase